MQKQTSVEAAKCINEWAHACWVPMTWHERRQARLTEWTNGYSFAKAPLPSATCTPSLSSYWSGLLLLRAASRWLFQSFCNPVLLFAQLLHCVSQPPASIPLTIERRRISHALPRAAVLMRFVTAAYTPTKAGASDWIANLHTALTMNSRPHISGCSERDSF